MKLTEFALPAPILQAIGEMGYQDATAIQEEALPALLQGQDVLGEAPTGTGKTAAYCLPMLSKINPGTSTVQGLVVCPTRELAVQVIEEISKFAKYLPTIHYVAIYGGQKVSTQLRELKKSPQILVGTPGRLKDLITRKIISLSHVNYVVLDEGDEMLDMGFLPDVTKILNQVTSPHQSALFSATMPSEISKVAARFLAKDALHVVVKRTLSQENQIAQKAVFVTEDGKKEAIVDLINSLSFRRAFVFCRTKHKVMQIAKILSKNTSHAITSLQGNLSQNKRDKSMEAFRSYNADVMVATDIAARGIDVNDVDLVVNYDVPEEDEFYLHRIGRTGRVDKSGSSYTFLTPQERDLVKKYEKMTHASIEIYTINKGDAMKKYLEGLEPKLKDDLSAEKAAISETCAALSAKEGHEVTPLELAAILLHEKMADPASSVAQEKDYSSKHNASIEKNKERKVLTTDPDNQRFFINVGFEDGATAEKLKGFIIQHAQGVEEDDFADIYLKGTFSFFEVPKLVADKVVFGVENTNFNGKNVHVEKTERPSGGPKPEKSFHKEKHFSGKSHYGYHHH